MEIKILFGSETGNSEGLAQGAKKDLQNCGYKVDILDMADLTVSDLAKFKNVLLITSTWGDGDPPTNAENFYKELKSTTSADLSELNYAVFAIGQSFYENFCKAGEDFDKFFAKFGAKRIIPIQTSDDDFDEKFPIWLQEIKTKFSD